MANNKKTVVLGASPNPSRYAFTAAKMLHERDISFVPVGIKTGEVFGEPIQNLRKKPSLSGIHTVTLYIGPQHQEEWYGYILSLKPQRIIFNLGLYPCTFKYRTVLKSTPIIFLGGFI